ncbi:tRNA pseudouridine32 synthase/23S rRNA pseudouridine746 synthase [Aeromonas sp. BIGb0405]|uniref:RluA family pseudouridine synthase n=1 Tax=Aeromonas TaxID=642 RepID=UPI001CCE24EE|nr:MULTISPECIES: RluA family pseudouridine synthase [Aeromonas]MCS3454444.1 tRNA pseudouridine32 synthase/23S rRNA pseudouridine746 synthase [Aeromonas sp. BIGb0405]MCS3459398.1 tRNA pseudouridine32 synthase/23S rRNA pseudouridine746 synthase [Aeromonas sp. BIGb0445]
MPAHPFRTKPPRQPMPNPAIIDNFIAPPCQGEIRILYRDQALLLIDKPSGLLSLSGKNAQNLDSVHYRLVQDFPGCTLVHRLDFGTSGLMLVALNKVVNAALCRQFSERTVEKGYLALLQGHLVEDEGVMDFPIAKDPAQFPLMKICAQEGKPARSRYRVLAREYWPHGERAMIPISRVALHPESGRTHQLRIHSQQLGYPMLGCDLYGGTAHALAGRLMLHAHRLSFNHPLTNERINAVCDCPF